MIGQVERVDEVLQDHGAVSAPDLVVEILSDSTEHRDRGIKLRSYARAGIAEYWIIDLVARRVEVYTRPDGGAAQATYRDRRVFGAEASVPLNLRGDRVGEVPVASILA